MAPAKISDAEAEARFTTTASGLTYDLSMPGGEGMPPMAFTATVAEGGANTAIAARLGVIATHEQGDIERLDARLF